MYFIKLIKDVTKQQSSESIGKRFAQTIVVGVNACKK